MFRARPVIWITALATNQDEWEFESPRAYQFKFPVPDFQQVRGYDIRAAGCTKIFTFCGWAFFDDGEKLLISYHRLPNPHPPEAYYAYKTYGRVFGREHAAAWLIAHWFEHYMNTCPCLNGDKPSKFRHACIEALL